MKTAINKLIENVDQLVIWLKENPNMPIPTEEKRRITSILDRIQNAKEISDEEWNKIESKINDNYKNSTSATSSNSGYVHCELCGDKLNKKNVIKHRNKCRGKRARQSKKPSASSKQKQTSKRATYTDKPYFNEYKENRRLDGSRDYWRIRDQGKFGSHSSYDDMGDESFP
jgi:hypothetical protein